MFERDRQEIVTRITNMIKTQIIFHLVEIALLLQGDNFLLFSSTS